jgi:hypothetical protein
MSVIGLRSGGLMPPQKYAPMDDPQVVQQTPIQQVPTGPALPEGPDQLPPNVPPPGWPGPGLPPVVPPPTQGPVDQGPTPLPPSKGDDSGDHINLKPWLIGAGVLGAGVLGAVALHDGARNVRALSATASAWSTGAMHQGGLQAISDAGLGARFTAGIGIGDYLAVATPGLNRIGTAGKLTAVARGQLDHAELLASSTALRHTVGDSVAVHEPLRTDVLDGLVRGRSLPSILGELDRSAAKARPVFDNPQLGRYWNQTSIVARGGRVDGHDVTGGASILRPELRLAPTTLAGDGKHVARYELQETGRNVPINRILVPRGADLDGRGLADGIGAIQGSNVSRLNPAMRARAIEASGVDPQLVDAVGLNRAYAARWSERLAPVVQ